jgi:hypothetical protein
MTHDGDVHDRIPTDPRLAGAVFNNVAWCDVVCRALGSDTGFVDGLWINRGASPPFYPNAITLVPDGSEAQVRRLRLMTDAGLPAGWGVKDSFCRLDLAGLGFDLAFEAEWLGLPADRARDATSSHEVRWEPVTSDSALATWKAAWRGGARNEIEEPDVPRIFAPTLLDDPDIRFLAAYRQDRIVGLVVGNRSDDGSGGVAGLSNLVLHADGGEGLRAGAVSAVASAFPGLPLVGYERGADLVAMQSLGFEPLGPLTVWLKR